MAERRIGPYEILGELGQGGQATVFRCATPDGVQVAVKVLHGSLEGLSKQRFEREAKVLARLRHPSLVRLLDAGEHKGRPYAVLDLVQGKTLQDRLREQGPLPVWEAAEVTALLARGLHYAHEEGVLHRDVNPNNVVLSADGPVLVDFGLAKPSEDVEAKLSTTGVFQGTLGFMPPEQLRGMRGEIDRRADVYGLGATFYAMLTGDGPHRGQALDILQQTLESRPDAPSALRQGIPRSLEQACLRCLAREPEDRWQTAEALADALEQPAVAGASKRPIFALAGGLLAGGLVLAAAAALLAGDPAGPPKRSEAAPSPAAPPQDAAPRLPASGAPAGGAPAGGAPAGGAPAGGAPAGSRAGGAPAFAAREALARQQLLRGIERVPDPIDAVSGPVAVYGPEAFALFTGQTELGATVAVAAAAFHGKGRVVALGHSSFFHPNGFGADGWSFAANVVAWLAGRDDLEGLDVGLLTFDERVRGLEERLRRAGARPRQIELASVTRSGAPVILWYAKNDWDMALRPADAERLVEYVAAGGGLWVGSCPWGTQQVRKIDLRDEYPMNWVLGPMGLLLDPAGRVRPASDAFLPGESRPQAVHGGHAIARLLGWDVTLYRGTEAEARAIAQRTLEALPKNDRVLVPRLLEELERSDAGAFRQALSAVAERRWRR